MAKRFTDTEKWNDPWFHSLTKDEKHLWFYLTDRCDHAGIWDANHALLRFHLGQMRYDLKKFEGRVVVLPSGKWFVPGFITFQYGRLNPENRAHLSVINRLQKLNLWPIPDDLLTMSTKGQNKPPSSPYSSPSEGAKDKEKDKESLSITRARDIGDQDFDRFWLLYPRHIKKQDALKAWNRIKPDETLRATMYGAIERQKISEQWLKEDGRFIPYPASWLNGRRWEDELPITSQQEVHDWRIAKPTAKP